MVPFTVLCACPFDNLSIVALLTGRFWMSILYRTTASVLLVALLAGCGAQGLAPAPAATQKSLVSAAMMSVDPNVQKLIADYNSINGFDESAMARRSAIVAALGESDSDLAMNFLQKEYDRLGSLPENVRATFETKLGDALTALDTYDPALDDAAIAAGPGTTLEQAETYYDAMTRSRRHKGFFAWLKTGLRNFWRGLTGRKPIKKRRRRPTPSTPSYPTDPSYNPSYN